MEPWLRTFIRKLFPYSASRMDIEKAFLTKHSHVPQKLYKYRVFSDNSRHALESDQLWFSSPSNFNDPFDTTVFFEITKFQVEDLSVDETLDSVAHIRALEKSGERWEPPTLTNPISSIEHLDKLISELTTSMPREIRESLWEFVTTHQAKLNEEMVEQVSARFRDGFSILSLSANPKSKLMWSHYAQSHTGFCIEYDFGSLDYDNIRKRLCCPVLYRSKRTNATRYIAKGQKDFNNLFGSYISLIKTNDWAYEQEWRIVHPTGPSHANGLMWMPSPSAIILGAGATPENANWATDFCLRRSIPLKRAKIGIGNQTVAIDG